MRLPLPLRLLPLLAVLTLCGCPPTNWYESYRTDGKNPYDLYVLHELLAARDAGASILYDTLDLRGLDSVRGTNYLFVGHQPHYASPAVTTLLDYVERGNTAILATGEVPEELARHLFGAGCYDDFAVGEARFPSERADSVVAFLYPAGDSFPLVNVRYWAPAAVPLRTISEKLLCDPGYDVQVLGTLDTLGVNFVRLGWGQGNFYLFSTPRYLTNWYVLDSTAVLYPAAVLSVLDTGRVYWDEYHRRYLQDPVAATDQPAERGYTGGRNLLSGNRTLLYIQEHRELTLAWYLLLVGAVLFVVFRGKRRQRIIPLLPARRNTSRRLIETLSRLGHRQGNHTALARRELVSLRFHLNHRRGVRWREGETPPEDLSIRLGLPQESVDRALTEIRMVEGGGKLREADLLRFYRAIEPLYG
ncbi:DUF4350 domain-containing protein [Neolewinella litorea]|uniref:DUF4350 domain-containing protein n=1 Tax=Neolewinella litorea TaxID=2562452 RepID=A0A4S4NK30_9BACT|nr:DUF4350 domain-containing protein [Neolewinella litorea]THH39295.1 DUF4350 domain-containing protein [Neolewinella litorea]